MNLIYLNPLKTIAFNVKKILGFTDNITIITLNSVVKVFFFFFFSFQSSNNSQSTNSTKGLHTSFTLGTHLLHCCLYRLMQKPTRTPWGIFKSLFLKLYLIKERYPVIFSLCLQTKSDKYMVSLLQLLNIKIF